MSREDSSAGIGHQALRTGRRSVPSAAWRDLTSMPSIQTSGKGATSSASGTDAAAAETPQPLITGW
jgi:hypothetical protein